MANANRILHQTNETKIEITPLDDLGRIQMSPRRSTVVEGRNVPPPHADESADPMPRSQRSTTNANSTGRFLSVGQAATELGMTPARCRRMIRTGQIAAIRIGSLGVWRIERTTISTVTNAGGDARDLPYP